MAVPPYPLLVKYLDQTHPDYDHKEWCELEALAEGGKKVHAHIGTFLPMNPGEPQQTYACRKGRASYVNYVAPIVHLYASFLFSSDFHPKVMTKGSSEQQDPDKFYGDFQEDVTGNEKTFKAFVRERFTQTLKTGKSYWLAERAPKPANAPENMSLREFEQLGLDRVTLKALPREELINWECDDKGRLLWALTWTKTFPQKGLAFVRGSVTVEVWRHYTPTTVQEFRLEYETSKPPVRDHAHASEGEPLEHGFKRVPIICLDVPEELCVGIQTKDPQLEHFRLDCALSWSLNRCAYAMPVVKVADDEKFQQTFGAGYYLQLGVDDDASYLSPPAESFEVLRKARDNKREEIYRVMHQMAQAVDNNAETVGRSADSKEIDQGAMRIMLNAYGEYVGEAIEETFELISESRGESDIEWSIEGLSGYDTATVASLIATSSAGRLLGIPSPTFHKHVTTKVAMAMLPEVDPKVKDVIRKEINEAEFEVTSVPSDLMQSDLDAAKAENERAKAKSEPLKAKASLKAASQPKPAPKAAGAKPARNKSED